MENYFPATKRLRSSAPRRALFDLTNSSDCENSNKNSDLRAIPHFSDFPSEIFNRILHFSDLQSLKNLALVDKKSRQLVSYYINSNSFVEKFRNILKNEDENAIDAAFSSVALVFKAATMVSRPSERISCTHNFFWKFNGFTLDDENDGRRCGLFWHKVTRGWEFQECSKAYNNLINFGQNSIQRMLINFFNNKPGKSPENEYRLRVFFRWFVLDYCLKKGEDLGFWAASLLADFTMYHQAKLLYLTFGPVDNDGRKIEWHKMSSVSASKELAESFFPKVVECLTSLMKTYPGKWSEDTIISLVEELTSFPDGWLLENFAHLLLYCDEKVLVGVITSRTINGRVEEVSYILHSMFLCVKRTHRSMLFVIRMFRIVIGEIPNETVRVQLIKTFARQLSDRIGQLYELFGVEGGDSIQDEIKAHEIFLGDALKFVLQAKVVSLDE